MAVDGSVIPQSFRIICPPKQLLRIETVSIKISDPNMRINRFASLPVLTNGIKIRSLDPDDNVTLDFLDGETIKALSGFNLVTAMVITKAVEPGDDTGSVNWNIASSGERLGLIPGGSFEFLIQDDLSAMVEMAVSTHGYLETPLE